MANPDYTQVLSTTPDTIISVSASFTRPANTTAYAAGDVVSTTAGQLITFSNICRYPDSGIQLSQIVLSKDEDVTNASFRLIFFSSAVTAIADNTAFTLTPTYANAIIGAVDIGPTVVEQASGNTASYVSTASSLILKAASGTRDIYAILTARAAYTPASAEVFNIRLIGRSF